MSPDAVERLTEFAASQTGTQLGHDIAALMADLQAQAAPIRRWAHVTAGGVTVSSSEAEVRSWAGIVGGSVVPCVDRDSQALLQAARALDAEGATFRAKLNAAS